MMKKFQTTGLWYDAWRRLKNDRVAMISLFIVIVFTLLAIYGELVYQYHNALDLTPNYQKTKNNLSSNIYMFKIWTEDLFKIVLWGSVLQVR